MINSMEETLSNKIQWSHVRITLLGVSNGQCMFLSGGRIVIVFFHEFRI